MPRFSVEYKGKWACYSTIVDAFITDFKSKDEHESWRRIEYGTEWEPIENCNVWTMAEAIENSMLNRCKVEIVDNLVKHGIDRSEAKEMWAKVKNRNRRKGGDRMFWIIFSGIISLGILPLLSVIGYGIELLVNIFTPVSWSYWGKAAVGLIFAILPGVRLINFTFKSRQGKIEDAK